MFLIRLNEGPNDGETYEWPVSPPVWGVKLAGATGVYVRETSVQTVEEINYRWRPRLDFTDVLGEPNEHNSPGGGLVVGPAFLILEEAQ